MPIAGWWIVPALLAVGFALAAVVLHRWGRERYQLSLRTAFVLVIAVAVLAFILSTMLQNFLETYAD